MTNFEFNRLYVIQSLPQRPDSMGGYLKESGEDLYDDLLRWQKLKYDALDVKFCNIQSKNEWDKIIKEIYDNCKLNGDKVILHLEIHGESSGTGLILGNGDFLGNEYIGNQLRQINEASGCNLFITLAVCMGLNVLYNMHYDLPMPFCGAIGSFDKITEGDLRLRFYEFYQEFFTSFDIGKAYVELSKANSNLPSKYRYIPADELFYRGYQRYIEEACTAGAVKKRAKESEQEVVCINRQQKRKFDREFIKLEKQTREKYFKAAVNTFFMLKQYPQNKNRFDIPNNLVELKQKSQNLVCV